MDAKKLFIFAGITTAAVLLLKKYGAPGGGNAEAPKTDHAKVVDLVEETLHEHQGETGSVVQAFEAALAHEPKPTS